MLAIQIIGVIFGLGMLYVTVLYSRRNQLNKGEYFVWSMLWILAILISVFPQALQTVTETLHFNRTLDMLMVGSIIFVVGISFYVYTIVRRTEQRVEELVRKTAIEDADKKKKE